MDVNVNAVDELMQRFPKADLIHGHTHRLNTHTNNNFTRHVLGDWSQTKGNGIKIEKTLSRFEVS